MFKMRTTFLIYAAFIIALAIILVYLSGTYPKFSPSGQLICISTPTLCPDFRLPDWDNACLGAGGHPAFTGREFWGCCGKGEMVCVDENGSTIELNHSAGGGCGTTHPCIATGCSGQICADHDVITTCEWRSEYSCYHLTDCACVNGTCAWDENPRFRDCMQSSGRIFCGGIGGLPCPAGFKCRLEGSYPDAGGVCEPE
jgi:eight-cysteine-cluster-containing protein